MDIKLKLKGLFITNSDYATPLKRFLSFIIDNIIIILITGFIIKGFIYFKIIDKNVINQEVIIRNEDGTEVVGINENDKNFKIFRNTFISVSFLYFVIFLSSKKQATIGNQIMKIMVVSIKRGNIGIMDAILKFLATFLNNTFFFVGYLLYFFREDSAFLQDVLSETRVIAV